MKKVTVYTGRNHTDREKKFFSRILSCSDDGAFAIIPDQYSFEFDKKLYSALGAKRFNMTETWGVSRLSEKLCRELGGSALTEPDDNSRIIAMYRAQVRLRAKGGLRFFSKALMRPVFVSECISLAGQIDRSGADSGSLIAAADRCQSGSARLLDLASIISEYKKVTEEMGYRGQVSQTRMAAQLSKEQRFFSGKNVFFEAFNNFSADELALLDSVISSCKSCVISLVYDENDERGQNPFSRTLRTLSNIRKIAGDNNYNIEIIPSEKIRQSPPLAALNRNIFSYSPDKTSSSGLVELAAAEDVYQESEYVCSKISQLVRNGAKYSEIAVICADLTEISGVISGTAGRYDIPCYLDMPEAAAASAPAKYIADILDAVLTKKYRTENILRVVRSPLSAFLDYEFLDLERFCVKWRVEGDMWKEPFDKTIADEYTPNAEKLRRAVIEPFEDFRNAAKGSEAAVICKEFFRLLDRLKISDQIYSTVKISSSGGETEYEIARRFKQVWQGIIGAVKSVYDNMPDEKISLRAFSDLLKLMLGVIKISAPPQKSDCVRIADADRSRLSGVRYLFIMQVNDGIFPGEVKNSGLMTEAEMSALSDMGIQVENSAGIRIENERLNVYCACTTATEALYVSCSLSDRSGSAQLPSPLLKTIASCFEDDVFIRVSELPRKFFCTSYRTAFYNYLEHSKEKTQESADIKASLLCNEEYAGKARFVHDAAQTKTDSISPETAAKLFFPDGTMNISATSAASFYRCPFSFFCRYGLKLYPQQTVEMNQIYIGNIAHRCLEDVMSLISDGKKVYNTRFPDMTDEELRSMVYAGADAYIEEEMGGDFGKNAQFRSALAHLKEAVFLIAANFRNEMKKSLFIPAVFEYDLSSENGEPMLSVRLSDPDIKINVRGHVDRADIYRTDNGSWVRIVDYKTGKQTFSEDEVYHGLDLQMLIYMLVLTSAGYAVSDERLRPAGIMYSHVRFVNASLHRSVTDQWEKSGELEEKLAMERAKAYKPDGLAADGEPLGGLNMDFDGVYTVLDLTSKGKLSEKKGQSLRSEEIMEAYGKFALSKVEEMAKSLSTGCIKADPIETGKNSNKVLPCVYCDYSGICKNANPFSPRRIDYSEDHNRLNAELQRIAEENTGFEGGDEDER